MSGAPIELYLKHLDKIFNQEPEFFSFASMDEISNPVVSIIYKNVPETGYITGLTFGLSTALHSEWINGRPELMICVKSEDVKWLHSIAFLAALHRSTSLFSYGSVFDLGSEISDESKMSCVFIYAPAISEASDFLDINIGEYNINIAGVYLIYYDEAQKMRQSNFRKLWDLKDYDIYSVNRKDLASLMI